MTGGWFTLTELQERLNRENKEKLRQAIRRAEIPMSRFGNDYLIREAVWLAWMEANESTLGVPRCGGNVRAERIDGL